MATLNPVKKKVVDLEGSNALVFCLVDLGVVALPCEITYVDLPCEKYEGVGLRLTDPISRIRSAISRTILLGDGRSLACFRLLQAHESSSDSLARQRVMSWRQRWAAHQSRRRR